MVTFCEPNACGGFLRNVLHVGSKSCLYELTELNFLSVGSQLPPRTLNISLYGLCNFHDDLLLQIC